MSILKVDTINEKTSGNGVQIAGHVVQYTSATSSATSIQNASTSYIATGLFINFTPKFATSKVLVTVQSRRFNLVTAPTMLLKCMRDGSTEIGLASDSNKQVYMRNSNSSSANQISVGLHWTWEDSPATTSSVRYEPYLNAPDGGNAYFADSGGAQLYIMEIAQ